MGQYSQVFSSNDTGCRQAEGPLYPDEKTDKAKYKGKRFLAHAFLYGPTFVSSTSTSLVLMSKLIM